MKMNMKQKIITVLLTVFMVMASTTGCGKTIENSSEATGVEENTKEVQTESVGNFNATGYPIVNDQITLQVLICFNDNSIIGDINELPAVQKLEEQTNIHIEWEIVKASDWNTKVNLIMASGEYPDVIISTQGSFDYENYGVDQGIVIPLDNYLTEEYMPEYTTRLGMEEEDCTRNLIASDGHMYTVPYLVAQKFCVNYEMFINQLWLDNLGLETPGTVEELTDTLRAFKNDDPNQNGEADEIPMLLAIENDDFSPYNMLPLFNVPSSGVYVDDATEEILYGCMQDGFRELAEWLNLCYKEGLLDIEVVSQDINACNTKMQEARVGFYPAWRLTGLGWDAMSQIATLWVPDEAMFDREIQGSDKSTYITKTNENIEATARWINAWLEEENMFNLYCGMYTEEEIPKADGWRYNEDGMIESVGSPYEAKANEMTELGVNGIFFAPPNWYYDKYVMPVDRIEKMEFGEIYDANGLVKKIGGAYLLSSYLGLDSDTQKKLSLIDTDLSTARSEYFVKFIMDGVTDDSWNAFISTLEDVGVAEYLEIYQNAYNAAYK